MAAPVFPLIPEPKNRSITTMTELHPVWKVVLYFFPLVIVDTIVLRAIRPAMHWPTIELKQIGIGMLVLFAIVAIFGKWTFAERVFIGRNGLRAGWRLMIYVFAVALLSGIVGAIVRAMGGHPPSPSNVNASSVILNESVQFLCVAGGALLMALLEKRDWQLYGIPLCQAFGKLFWQGAAWGFACITIVLLILRASGAFYFGSLALHGGDIVKFGLLWMLAMLLVGFFEEFFLRGYTLFTLTSGMGFWGSALLLSCLFGLAHANNEGESKVGVFAAGFIGLFFCFALRRTGNLWWPIGFHMAWNWGETFLYSTPDSGMVAPGHLLSSSFQGPVWLTGGTVGPEGSVLCLGMIVLLFPIFHFVYPQAKYPPAPPEAAIDVAPLQPAVALPES